MSEWRTMEAGPELDRLVAERLGWTELVDNHVFETVYIDTRSIVEYGPCLAGIPPGNDKLAPVPPFSLSIDAAVTVRLWGGAWLEMHTGGYYGNTARIWEPLTPFPESTWIDKSGLAECVCKAWLSYMEGKDDGKSR